MADNLLRGSDGQSIATSESAGVHTIKAQVSASALPTGAATEATLAAANAKITACNTGAVVLAAGSAAIGKVGIDQTTPGTTNKVSLGTDTIRVEEVNPEPTPILLSSQTGTFATSGDNTIITPAAGKYVAIFSLVLQSESAVETLAIVKNGSTAVARFLATAKGAGIALEFPERSPLIIDDNSTLKINLSGANQFGYSMRHEIRDI
jgi:hypothetical protein